MQKFTRPLTREIELAGERLALTFTTEGISVRPVGSRKPPTETTWAAILCHLAGPGAALTKEDAARAIQTLKAGGATKAAPPAASPPTAEHSTAGSSAPPETASESDTAALLAQLDKWFKAHRSRYAAALAPGATPAELDALKTALGRPLPPDLRTLLAWHNGQGEEFAGAFEQSWRLMSTQQIAEAKQQLDAEAGTDGWQAAWVPFLEDDNGDYVCLDTSQHGEPVREFWLGRTDHPVVAPSLAAWLKDFVKTTEGGGYVEDPERGEFLRKQH